MTLEVLFGVAVIVVVALSLVPKLAVKRQPPTRFFKCARCNTTAPHTSRTIEAWRNKKTAFFCQACHAKWLQSHPSQERTSPTPVAGSSGCLGVAVLAVLVPVGVSLTWARAGTTQAGHPLPPPAWPVPDIRPSGTRFQPATGITLGSLHVAFEKTTFDDVRHGLGLAPIGRQGEAGEFLMWVCYTLPTAHARIWLTSSELGEERFIDGMVAKQLQDGEAESALCPVPINGADVVSIDNGIWLGDPVEKIKGILGTPNEAPASVIYYLYEGKDGEFDITSLLALRIHEGRVTELHAEHSATN